MGPFSSASHSPDYSRAHLLHTAPLLVRHALELYGCVSEDWKPKGASNATEEEGFEPPVGNQPNTTPRRPIYPTSVDF